MTSEVTLFKSGIPDYLKSQELNEITKSLLGGGGLQIKRISIRGGVFRLIVNGKEIATNEERSMKVVLVNVAPKVSRTFYEGTYDPNVKSAPSCWSADGDRPDKSITDPQNASCNGCDQNIKGPTGRPCRFSRMLAVVLDNDLGGDVFQLSLPSQSIFGKGEDGKLPLNAYAQFLAGFNVNITSVVTEMRFDTGSATPKLTFKAVRPLTEAEYETCMGQGQTPEAKTAIALSFGGATPSVAEAETPKLARPREQGEDAKPVIEPKKRESKDKEPAPKKTLADVLNAWDDED